MANYYTKEGIGIIEVHNPPVNALGRAPRIGIQDGLEKAQKDPNVKAIVLCGKGKTFPAGADIKEFAHRDALTRGASLSEICNFLEGSSKPVVAAVHGTALGGGCELTISCHYRVVHEKTIFGFPEVDIGILPAATGTQRFPRLVGLKFALETIPTGKRFGVKEAQKYGMVDKVVSSNLVEEAITFAKSVASKPLDDRKTSRRAVRDADKADRLREAAMRVANTKSKGMLSPIYCIKSVMAAVEYPFEQGLEKEMEYSVHLFTSGQSKALQYAFFAQRAATKWEIPDGANYQTVKPKHIKTGAVIGAGTMGTGIAMCMLNAGIPTVLIEQNQKFLDRGVNALKNLYSGSVKLGKMTEKQMKAILSQLKPSVDYNDIRNVDIVIEAVFEKMDLKKEVFRKLDQYCKPGAFLCSNTSSLDIDEIASATKRPEAVAGVHFFAPAYIMKLLENIRGAKSSPETIATVMAFGSRIGKVPVLVGNCQGFCGNRMRGPYGTEATFMVEEGAWPEEIDRELENFGMLMGLFKTGDLSGLDIGWNIRKEFAKKRGITLDKSKRFVNGERISHLSDMLAEEGRFGRKTGKGWYKYEKVGGKDATPDEYVREMIIRYCREMGYERQSIPPQEIIERTTYSLINEGFKCLEEGIAAKPEDIDTIMLLGFAWPRYTGGPMYMANQIGLKNVYDRLCYYYDKHPTSPHLQPSELLRRCAMNNAPMRGWVQHRVGKL